jgi:multiple sugar transport system permease protein
MGSTKPRRRTSQARRRRLDNAVGLTFVAPQLLGVIAFGIVPLGFAVWYSLHEWSPLAGTFTFTGAQNYRQLLTDPAVRSSLLVTLVFALLLVTTNIVVSLSLALLVNRKIAGVVVFRTVYFSPVVVSAVAWTVVWSYLLASNGGINAILRQLGVAGPNWLKETPFALLAVVTVQLIKGLGMNMVLFLAALQNVPAQLLEAAQLDGAGSLRRFRSVTVPLIAPTMLLVVIITTSGALDVFAPIQVLTKGGPDGSTTVISYYLYQVAFVQQRFGYGSTVGILLFVITAGLALLQWSSRKRWVHDEV